MLHLVSRFLRGLDGFLGLERELIESHSGAPSSVN
jgi:hypothetical protein